MRNRPDPVTIINIETCTNLEEAIDIMDKDHNAPCTVTLGNMSSDCVAFVGVGDITSREYRRRMHVVALLSNNNVGPITMDSEGGVWTTESRMGSPLSIKVAQLSTYGPMEFTIGEFTQYARLLGVEEVEAYED
jgi:hypothetical protein